MSRKPKFYLWEIQFFSKTLLLLTKKKADTLPVEAIVSEKQQHHHHTAGTGSCTLCDCPQFIPSTGDETCINYNSVGGTCNHYEYEHNPEQ